MENIYTVSILEACNKWRWLNLYVRAWKEANHVLSFIQKGSIAILCLLFYFFQVRMFA